MTLEAWLQKKKKKKKNGLAPKLIYCLFNGFRAVK